MTSPLAPSPPARPGSALASLALLIAPLALALLSPVGCERLTDGYPIGIERLRACPLAVEALGQDPGKTWGLSTFRVGSSGSSGSARFSMKVAGSRQRGDYTFSLSRAFGTWTLVQAQLLVPSGQRAIDVLRCSDVSPGLPAAFASVAALPGMPLVPPSAASGLAVLAPPPPGLTGIPLVAHYCQNGLPAVCAAAARPYLQGVGVPQDTKRARELLDVGCAARAPDACAERARLPAP